MANIFTLGERNIFLPTAKGVLIIFFVEKAGRIKDNVLCYKSSSAAVCSCRGNNST